MEHDREDRRIARVLLTAVVVVFGLQALRFLFASLTWYLRDTVGIGVIDLIPIAFAPFLAGALLPLTVRWLGFRNGLAVGAFVLVVARLLNQVTTDPGQDLWLAMLATAAFVGLLPYLFGLGRSSLVGGVLLGIAIDSAIKGLGFSLDLAYQPGWRSVVAVAALGLALAWAYNGIGGVSIHGIRWAGALPLLGLAPYLFTQMLLFQNQGWLSSVTGISGPTAQLRIALLNIVAIYVAYRLAGSRIAYAGALAVVVATIILAEAGRTTFDLAALFAVPAAGILWAGMVPEPETEKMGVSATVLVGAAALLLVFGLAYYVPLDMNLGFEGGAVRIAASILLLGLGLAALPRIESLPAVGRVDWVLAAAASVLPLVAFASALNFDIVPSEEGEALRVVSYNIHSAFNTDGTLDIDAIARVIEDTRADVVGLQEVPRGRLLSANTDTLTLLQQALGFEHIAFFGTTDPVWGNAILSRYPIVDVVTDPLPKVGTPMQRGYLGAMVDVDGVQVLVISTHLQHLNDPEVHDVDPERDLLGVHSAQIETILDDWGGYQPAVLVGDFNARPDWAQIGLLTSAGWFDSWPEAGSGDGFTSNSADPQHRIDYIFHTAGITAVDAGVIQSMASDHFAVVADLLVE